VTDVDKDQLIREYERVVCYYTLPKMISPVTVGLIAAYALCVLESAAALAYGTYIQDRTWTLAGLYSLVGILVFGMIAFTIRAWRTDWRIRMALAVARNAPDPAEEEDVPDPFENHMLLSRPFRTAEDKFGCVDRNGGISYYVEIRRPNVHWRVKDAQDLALLDVRAVHGPGQLRVYAGKEHRASIERRMTLRGVAARVDLVGPEPRHYLITNGCIYDSGRMAGRIYRLRRRIYLDVEQAHFNDGLLAYLATVR